jgi:2-iminobutanoate/2-iminopropanoate deaminase
MKFVEGGVQAQARQALQNLKKIVEASGSEVGKIVKTMVRAKRASETAAYELIACPRYS